MKLRNPKFMLSVAPRLRSVLFIALIIVSVSGAVTLFYFIKFAVMVDRRLSSDVFKQSAKIYAALPEPDPKTAGSPISFSATVPPLITNFFDASRTKRRLVEFNQIPKVLLSAVLSGEDRVFFDHFGLNPKRIAGAFVSNLKQNGRLQGASTITQQLARNLFLTREPTLRRKFSEALIALILEQRLTKEQIFTMYANEVYLGHRESFAVHGFAEAAKAYFGKDLQKLTLSEAATLAGIIPAPNAYSPLHHPDRAKNRRDLILRIMFTNGEITREAYDEAKRSDLKVVANMDPAEGYYLVDYIREQLRADFPEEELMTGNLAIFTTVDLQLQKAAIDSVQNGLALVDGQLAKRFGKSWKLKLPTPQAGLIALNPHTGEIKAMVGGAHYGATQYNRVTKGFRQPGSIFKPFVYAAALETAQAGFAQYDFDPYDSEAPGFITPLTTLLDEPMVFYSPDKYSPEKTYSPRNYKNQYHGAVTLRAAFQHSLNIPTVMLAQRIGYERVAQLAKRMGLNPQIRGYPSVALGAFEVTPLEIAGAYTAFANGGSRVQPHALKAIVAADGQVVKTYQFPPQPVLSPQIAYLMTHLMEGVINSGTGAGVRGRGFMLPAAGKTGTSRDGWFAGYTTDLLVITWVGFDDGRDLKLEGARSALPIWAEFMKKAYQLYPPRNPGSMYFAPPSGIELVQIDAASLTRGDPYCGDYFVEAFLVGTAPTTSCLADSDRFAPLDLGGTD